jgi:hypothetical protein
MDPASDWVASGGKGALDFDGSNDSVQVSAIYSALISSKIFSLSFWMRTSATNTNTFPLSLGNSASDNAVCGFRMSPAGAGTIALVFRDNAGNFVIPGEVTVVNNGQWNHVAAVASGSTAQVYVNGSASGSASSISSLGATTINRVTIGALGRTSVIAFYSGLVDDAIIFNTALAANEVREIYRLGRGYGVFPEPDLDEGFAAAFNRRRRVLLTAG